MPEYPDIENYVAGLERWVLGQTLEEMTFKDPFLLRTVSPKPEECAGQKVVSVRRLGKRVVLGLEAPPDGGEAIYIVVHLMIAGRLRWRATAPKTGWIPSALMRFRFPAGLLYLTEAGTKRRARIYIERGQAAVLLHDPGGLEIFECTIEDFASRLTLRNHTLKRALTDPHLFSGIGNAYSDELLHRARMSPVRLTQKLTPAEIERLFVATRETLASWAELLRSEVGEGFPEHVTAFHPKMAVHGRYGEECPDCHGTVQRIRYADNETNYCPNCQTEGRLLADRSLSRLLKKDWPRSLDELEDHLAQRRAE